MDIICTLTDRAQNHILVSLNADSLNVCHVIYLHFARANNMIVVRGRWKRNVLINDALNTFYLRLYEVGRMANDHSNSERGNPLPPLHGIFFRLAARVLLYAPSHRQDSTYHGLWYTSCGALAGPTHSSVGPPSGVEPTTHSTMSGRSTTELHLASGRKDGRKEILY